jgi:hypothetical protein
VTKYVIDAGVAPRLAAERATIGAEHKLLAPTLIRSQVLARLYEAVGRGELTKKDASGPLD